MYVGMYVYISFLLLLLLPYCVCQGKLTYPYILPVEISHSQLTFILTQHNAPHSFYLVQADYD